MEVLVELVLIEVEILVEVDVVTGTSTANTCAKPSNPAPLQVIIK